MVPEGIFIAPQTGHNFSSFVKLMKISKLEVDTPVFAEVSHRSPQFLCLPSVQATNVCMISHQSDPQGFGL